MHRFHLAALPLLGLALSTVLACKLEVTTDPDGGDDAGPQPDTVAEVAEPVWPDEPFRSERPEPRPIRSLEIPTISTFELDNGLEVYLVQQDKLPTVMMFFEFDIGRADDPRGKTVAGVCSDLIDEATANKDKATFAAAQSDHAVMIWTGASDERSTIGLRSLKRELPAALDLTAEMIVEPGLRKQDFERIRKQDKNSIAQSKKSPSSIARRVFPAMLWGRDHAYGQIATEAAVDKVTLSDCKKWAAKLRPDGAKLWVVGKITEAEIREAMGERFAKWKGKAPKARKVKPAKPAKGTIFFVHVPGAAQSQITIGHPGPARAADDYEATQMVAAILGGSFSSRLNMNLREDKGWAYGARGGFYYRRGGGYFTGGSSVRTDATAGALREIAKEIAIMRTSDPTEVELKRERDGALLSLPADFANGTQTLFEFRNLAFYGLPLDWHVGHQERLRGLTIADVRAAAETHLQPSDYVVVVAGDGAVVLEDVEKIAEEGLFGDGGLVFVDADGVRTGRPSFE